jgi:replication-associated recombination protein RarA
MTARPDPQVRRRLTTTRGYQLSDVASALQKTIRRGDARLAGYFAIEIFESGYAAYAWRRLLTISAEDCAGIVTQEIKSLHDAWVLIDRAQKGRGRVFLAKAAILLCLAQKSRDADHLGILVYDSRSVTDAAIATLLAEVRATEQPIPEYAFDVHTGKGKRAGKTRRDFLLSEDAALHPRGRTLFDDEVTALRSGELVAREKGRV